LPLSTSAYRDNRTPRRRQCRAPLGPAACRRIRPGAARRSPTSDDEGWNRLPRNGSAPTARRQPTAAGPGRLADLRGRALDEGQTTPPAAVGFLPKAGLAGRPPSSIASTRPPRPSGRDHPRPCLRSGAPRGVCVCPLRADDRNNLADVRAYLGKQPPGPAPPRRRSPPWRTNPAASSCLARAAGSRRSAPGSFSVADAPAAIGGRGRSLDQSQRAVSPSTRESWQRVLPKREDEESPGPPFAGPDGGPVFTWIGEGEIDYVLAWYERECPAPARRGSGTPFRLRAAGAAADVVPRPAGAEPKSFCQIRHQKRGAITCCRPEGPGGRPAGPGRACTPARRPLLPGRGRPLRLVADQPLRPIVRRPPTCSPPRPAAATAPALGIGRTAAGRSWTTLERHASATNGAAAEGRRRHDRPIGPRPVPRTTRKALAPRAGGPAGYDEAAVAKLARLPRLHRARDRRPPERTGPRRSGCSLTRSRATRPRCARAAEARREGRPADGSGRPWFRLLNPHCPAWACCGPSRGHTAGVDRGGGLSRRRPATPSPAVVTRRCAYWDLAAGTRPASSKDTSMR